MDKIEEIMKLVSNLDEPQIKIIQLRLREQIASIRVKKKRDKYVPAEISDKHKKRMIEYNPYLRDRL
jgi:hypothetical protein